MSLQAKKKPRILGLVLSPCFDLDEESPLCFKSSSDDFVDLGSNPFLQNACSFFHQTNCSQTRSSSDTHQYRGIVVNREHATMCHKEEHENIIVSQVLANMHQKLVLQTQLVSVDTLRMQAPNPAGTEIIRSEFVPPLVCISKSKKQIPKYPKSEMKSINSKSASTKEFVEHSVTSRKAESNYNRNNRKTNVLINRWTRAKENREEKGGFSEMIRCIKKPSGVSEKCDSISQDQAAQTTRTFDESFSSRKLLISQQSKLRRVTVAGSGQSQEKRLNEQRACLRERKSSQNVRALNQIEQQLPQHQQTKLSSSHLLSCSSSNSMLSLIEFMQPVYVSSTTQQTTVKINEKDSVTKKKIQSCNVSARSSKSPMRTKVEEVAAKQLRFPMVYTIDLFGCKAGKADLSAVDHYSDKENLPLNTLMKLQNDNQQQFNKEGTMNLLSQRQAIDDKTVTSRVKEVTKANSKIKLNQNEITGFTIGGVFIANTVEKKANNFKDFRIKPAFKLPQKQLPRKQCIKYKAKSPGKV